MGVDRRSALGVLLLAAVALLLPPLLSRPGRPSAPPAEILYVVEGDLLWSPVETPALVGADGLVFDAAGRVVGRLGGWRGLLLGAPLDINQAAAEDWEALPGIGPSLAASIVEMREALGGFRDPADLLRVRGIGPKKLEQLRPFLGPGVVEP